MDDLPENILKYVKNKKFKTDQTGLSASKVYIFDDVVLKIEKYTAHTKDMVLMMKWLRGKVPVPKILVHEINNNESYLLMNKIEGTMACDTYFLDHSEQLLNILAKAFKLFWSIDITDCPINKDIDTKLKDARQRIENNLVDREIFPIEEFKDPEELLIWLENNKPEYEPVLSHGDFCLPNILLEGDQINGFIDLGDAGVSDKWYDLTLCYISLKNNFNGTFGGKVYQNFDPDLLFKVLGIEPNCQKLKYFMLLEELY